MHTADGASLHVDLQVFGTGAALPGTALTTSELLQRVRSHLTAADFALSAKVARRLAVHSRHVSRDFLLPVEAPRPQDAAPALAARAIGMAVAGSGLAPHDLRFLIGHTATPHTQLPSNIAWTADLLDFGGPHLELRQACTGFASAALSAAGLCGAGLSPLAIAGSECGSVLFDPRHIAGDRSQLVNLVQMGDGAGAIVLGRPRSCSASRIEFLYYGCRGLQREPAISMAESGSGRPQVDGGVPRFAHRFEDVRAHGLELLRAGMRSLQAAGFTRERIDWWIPHQANGRMDAVCAQHLQLPAARTVCDAGALGNLGSAAIWVSLDRLRRSGHLSRGERVAVLGAEASKFMYGGLVYRHGDT